jgi:cation transport ATPase
MKAYPPLFLAVLWSVLSLLLLSGLVLLPGMLTLRLEWDVPEQLLPSARSLWAAGHGLLTLVTMVLLGVLLPIHVRHGLRQAKSRRSGLSLLVLMCALAITGWGIYYVANEDWARWASSLHVTVGLAAAAVVLIHVSLARLPNRASATRFPS